MELDQLTDEQIANLTPEQIETLENNPEKLDEILEGQAAKDDTKDDSTKDKPKQAVKDSAANDAGETEEGDDDKEPVVLNKSGKGIIPYEKHKELRVEVSSLREKLQKAQTENAVSVSKLNELLQKKDEATTDAEVDEATKALTKHLQNMEENFPEIGTVINAVRNETKSAIEKAVKKIVKEHEDQRKTLEELKLDREETKRATQQSVEEQVAEAKDNNPDLSHWEANDPEAWDEALRQDEILRTSAKWAKKPYPERFEEVVRRVRAIYPEASATKKTPDPKETKAKADAKVKEASARKPTTLSDIQGGANPASEGDEINNLSPLDLVAKLMKTPAQKASAMRAELPD